jgi:hypothetical protein
VEYYGISEILNPKNAEFKKTTYNSHVAREADKFGLSLTIIIL